MKLHENITFNQLKESYENLLSQRSDTLQIMELYCKYNSKASKWVSKVVTDDALRMICDVYNTNHSVGLKMICDFLMNTFKPIILNPKKADISEVSDILKLNSVNTMMSILVNNEEFDFVMIFIEKWAEAAYNELRGTKKWKSIEIAPPEYIQMQILLEEDRDYLNKISEEVLDMIDKNDGEYDYLKHTQRDFYFDDLDIDSFRLGDEEVVILLSIH